jgi:hypothetical protein
MLASHPFVNAKLTMSPFQSFSGDSIAANFAGHVVSLVIAVALVVERWVHRWSFAFSMAKLWAKTLVLQRSKFNAAVDQHGWFAHPLNHCSCGERIGRMTTRSHPSVSMGLLGVACKKMFSLTLKLSVDLADTIGFAKASIQLRFGYRCSNCCGVGSPIALQRPAGVGLKLLPRAQSLLRAWGLQNSIVCTSPSLVSANKKPARGACGLWVIHL